MRPDRDRGGDDQHSDHRDPARTNTEAQPRRRRLFLALVFVLGQHFGHPATFLTEVAFFDDLISLVFLISLATAVAAFPAGGVATLAGFFVLGRPLCCASASRCSASSPLTS